MGRLIVYLFILALFILLMLLSAKERVWEEDRKEILLRPFQKCGVYIFRQIRRWGSRGHHLCAWNSTVTQDMRILDPSKDTRKHELQYRIGKISNLLLFWFLADVLAILSWYAQSQNRQILQEGYIVRGEHGEKEQEIHAQLELLEEGEESDVQNYVFQVDAQQYTKEETDALARQFFEDLPGLILGENRDLAHVHADLHLLSHYEPYPFRVEWKSSRYSLVGTDGAVHVEDLTEGMTQEVTLSATARYEQEIHEQEIQLTLVPIVLTEKERFRQDVQQALEEENQASITRKNYTLPTRVDDVPFIWKEEIRDDSLLLFLLIAAAGVINFLLSDRELHRRIEQRQREMAIDYPQILSKIVLFLGAGMSVRNIFQKLGADYQQQREKGGRQQYVYEEILLVCHELDSGISEYDAYTHFGMRCRMRQYIKLCSLLTQNLRKGNAALLSVLQEEADLAFVERKNIARQLGEEAGTKLLLPMMMMLAVTLVIIIIPAYYSFSL